MIWSYIIISTSMEIAESTYPTELSVADATLKFYSPPKHHKNKLIKLPKY